MKMRMRCLTAAAFAKVQSHQLHHVRFQEIDIPPWDTFGLSQRARFGCVKRRCWSIDGFLWDSSTFGWYLHGCFTSRYIQHCNETRKKEIKIHKPFKRKIKFVNYNRFASLIAMHLLCTLVNDYGNHRKINVGNYELFGIEWVDFMRGTNRWRRSLYLSILINCKRQTRVYSLRSNLVVRQRGKSTLYANAHSGRARTFQAHSYRRFNNL